MSQHVKCTPGGKNPVPALAQRMTDLIDSEYRGCQSLLSTRTIALQLVELVADHIRNAPAGQVDPLLASAWLARDPSVNPPAFSELVRDEFRLCAGPDLRAEDHL